MAQKKYFWLRLQKDFFKRHDIRIIESMPNGKDYILFYLKLLVESVSHEGNLRYSDTIPYSDEMLSTITSTNIDVVKAAMSAFIELEMIEILDDSTIYMNAIEDMIGESKRDDHTRERDRIRQQKCRARKRLECDNSVTVTPMSHDSNMTCHTELEKELEKELEIDNKKPVRHKYGEYENVLLDDTQMDKLKNEFPSDYQQRIDNLSRYMKSTGKSYKDHLATIRNWARRDADKSETKSKTRHDYMRNDYDMAALEQMLIEG